MFPKISNLNEFKSHVDIPEIRFTTHDNGCVVCSYMISNEETFNTPWKREARGITFNSKGQIVSRPLHKFFNLNEREGTRFENIDWNKVVRITTKIDGSFIHTVDMGNGEFELKSKRSFKSDVAIKAKEWMKDKQNYIEFCKHVIAAGCTAIFEWTSPTSRIVLPYKEDCLTLLYIRHNIQGYYYDGCIIKYIAEKWNIPVVEEPKMFDIFMNKNLLQKAIEDTKGIEGWVVQFENGDFIKIKTKEYCEKHRTITFLRYRDVVSMIIDETIDDLKSILVGEGFDIVEILALENEVVNCLNDIREIISVNYEVKKHLDRKEFALYYKNHKYFDLLMQVYSGKEPRIKEYFTHNILPLYRLDQINLQQMEN